LRSTAAQQRPRAVGMARSQARDSAHPVNYKSRCYIARCDLRSSGEVIEGMEAS
jgi:hypothetical protein